MLILFAFIVFASLGLSWLLTGCVLHMLMRLRIVDRATERSNHTYVRAIGGGWALLFTIFVILPNLGWLTGELERVLWLCAGLIILAVISWIDDLHRLRVLTRFMVQIAAVACGMAALPANDIFAAWLPHWLELGLTVFGWLWFVNLYNFMDGLDGITGSQTVAVGIAIMLVTMLVVLPPIIPLTAALLIGLSLGFLSWNWAPSRLFMGDVGSVPLGFLVGWVLLYTAKSGFVAAAGITVLYYCADTTWTLLRRILTGKPFWQSHTEHFYNQALQGTRGQHVPIVMRMIAANLALLPCIWLAVYHGAWALLPASVIVLALIFEYKRLYCRGTRQGSLNF